MAEVVSELDKLREAAKLIEEMSQGRLQVCPSVVGQVYIRPENEAYGDIYGRLDALLNLTNQSGYHVQYTEDGKMEFRVWDLSVDLQNASFASADSAGNRLIADCEIELEVPVSFGGRLLPPMRMTVKVSAGYTPRF